MSATVHACPVCGKQILIQCWHDGREIQCVDMPKEQALHLLKVTRRILEDEIESVDDHVKKISEIQ